jgi:hypothetical protein
MLLSDGERAFLAAFIREATTDPFKGPATEELHHRNIYYTDLSHLLEAYYRESSTTTEGFGGKYDPRPPSCPWQDWRMQLAATAKSKWNCGKSPNKAWLETPVRISEPRQN